jgi:hypothetical protein
MAAPGALDFYIVRVGLTEDWQHRKPPLPVRDVAPDAADTSAGTDGWYHFDPAQEPWRIGTWQVTVPGQRAVDLTVTPTGRDGGMRLMATYAFNDPASRDGQAVILPIDIVPPPADSTLYLPLALRRYALRPPSADATVWAGMDALAATAKFRMTYDVTNPARPEIEALREHEFDRDSGVDVVSRPKHSADKWQIRFLNNVYYEASHSVWRCDAPAWYLFLRPEFIARLYSEFPRAGWIADGRAISDPTLLQFKARSDALDRSYLAQVPEAGGPVRLLSWTAGNPAAPAERQVYRFRAFNDPEILVGRPRGVSCDELQDNT